MNVVVAEENGEEAGKRDEGMSKQWPLLLMQRVLSIGKETESHATSLLNGHIRPLPEICILIPCTPVDLVYT